MFEKILCVVDSLGGARVSLAHLEEFKKAGTQEVIVFGVITMEGCAWTGRNLEQCRADGFEKEKNQMETVLKEIEKHGIKGKVRIEVGTSGRTILKVADEEQASLIVMGTGSRNVKGLLLGRAVEKVVQQARVPVLVMR
jgi:universal stress protein A